MPLRPTGSGALQLLQDACINGFEKFSGFAQSSIHFLPAWPEVPQFFKTVDPQYRGLFKNFKGSAGANAAERFANPVELVGDT